jgi:hypothetical protein
MQQKIEDSFGVRGIKNEVLRIVVSRTDRRAISAVQRLPGRSASVGSLQLVGLRLRYLRFALKGPHETFQTQTQIET